MTTGTRAPRNRLVLVIEDEADVLDLLEAHLCRLGYTVLRAETGEDGITVARAHTPAIVLVDMMLPGIDGRAVVTALRDDPSTAAAYVVVTTVLDPADLSDVPADAVLPKPFTRADVAHVLDSLDNAPETLACPLS